MFGAMKCTGRAVGEADVLRTSHATERIDLRRAARPESSVRPQLRIRAASAAGVIGAAVTTAQWRCISRPALAVVDFA